MRWRRRPEGFNLAFLDIMSCGLGAIILIFMLVKYQTDDPGVEAGRLQAEVAGIQNEISAVASGNDALAAQIATLKRELQDEIQRSAQADEKRAAAAEELIALSKEISRLERRLAQQQQAAAAQKNAEPTATDKNLQQDHLIGLRVEGKRILILLDNSASMADERLVDIIKIKAANTAVKKAAPKWQRTLAIAQWIIERVPEDSRYVVVRYNDKAEFLPDAQWVRGNDAPARAAVIDAMHDLHPQNATNLHAALQLIKTGAFTPTDIYVITDSLPTKGFDSLSKLQRSRACGLFTAKATTVSGECREALFYAAIKSFANSRAKVNTVLLPIEGDPDAAYAYWLWAASTTGMMISPAGSWP